MTAWSPFEHRAFRILYTAQFMSNVGTWMQVVGAQWLMGDLGGGPLEVALVQTAMTLPVFLLVIPSGALGDILDRRRILVTAQSAMLVVAATLAILTLADVTTPALLLALTFLLGTGQALVMPSWQAVMPELVPRHEIPQVATLNGVSMNTARAIGPAIGGVIIAASGPGAVFAINAVSFLATVTALTAWKRERPERTLGAESVIAAIRAGGRYVRSAPALRRLLARAAGFMVFASALWALLPVLARDRLGLDSGGYGLLLGSVGIGALTGAAVLHPLRARLSPNVLVTSASLLFAAACVVLALADSVAVAVAALPFAGLAWISVLSSLNAGAQALLPAWARARGLSYYLLVFMGGQALGAAAWGVVATHTSLRTTFLASATGLALAAIGARRFPLHAFQADLTPSRHWPEPHVVIEPEMESGPVLVTVEYRVPEENADAFRVAMAPVGRSRRRTGAFRWGLYQDATDPARFLETYEVATWGEHLRQLEERLTVRDEEFEARARALIEADSEPAVTHLFAATQNRG